MFEEFIQDNIIAFLEDGSEEVGPEVKFKRIQTCKSCKFYGEVRPMWFMTGKGCTICGCPVETKAHFKSIVREKNKLGESLTAKELLKMKLKLVKEGDKEIEIVECPKGFWAE